MTRQPSQAVGVFDSGIGGLSVLQALHSALPREHFVYVADNAHAPYGEKSDFFVRQRTHAITQHLLEQYHIKALVVACNTATAAAIHELRSKHPGLIVVGVEPALKPAVAISRTGKIGVMATQGTVSSHKFSRLLASVQDQAQFVVQACNGLALAIEQSALTERPFQAQTHTKALLAQHTHAMGTFGTAPGQIDTLVLGCTHYVFVQNDLQALLGPEIKMVSTGEPVAKQTRRLLESAGLMNPGPAAPSTKDHFTLLSTGELHGLRAASQRWLNLPASVCHASQSGI